MVKFTNIFESVEQMKDIEDVILIGGENKTDLLWYHLRKRGYNSIPCGTVQSIIEELNGLPSWGMCVSLLVIEPEMVKNSNDDLIAELIRCAQNIPFILLDEPDILSSIEDWFSEAAQHLTFTGSELIEHVFRNQCMKSLWLAEAELLKLQDGTSDAQAVETISYATDKIAELATQMTRPGVKALALKTIDLLENIQHSEEIVILDADKKSLFALLDAINIKLNVIQQPVLKDGRLP